MPKEIVTEAATIEQAKAEAAAALGVEEDALDFEVLVQPQKKTLGLFGGSMARVRAVTRETPAQGAVEYLNTILGGLGVRDLIVTIKEQNDKGCILMLEGEGLGVVIGRRGETLDALQYLTGLVANRVQNSYFRVTLDTGNYREKREQSLTGLARKMAGQASRTGRKLSLEPMNPYERRIIHTAVQEIEGATSWSVGSDSSRHVVIGPSDDNPVKSSGGGGNRNRGRRGGRSRRSGGGDQPAQVSEFDASQIERQNYTEREERPERGGRPERGNRPERGQRQLRDRDTVERPEREVRKFVPRSNPLPTVDGATPPSKTQSDVEKTSSLYGRIDL